MRKTEAVADQRKPTLLAVRPKTSVSLCHEVAAHAVAPIRRPPLQSDSPALAPYTNTLVCAVEGCDEGEKLETTRGRNISGNCIPPCICNGRFETPKKNTFTVASAAAASPEFVKPEMRHTLGAILVRVAAGENSNKR